MTGQLGPESKRSWSVQLLIEVLEKALSLSRVADAERILKRATAQVEQRIVAREPIDPKQLATLSLAAARVSAESGDPTWGCWAAQVYRRVEHVPYVALVDKLTELSTRHPGEIAEAVDLLATHCRGIDRRLSNDETEALARLEQLRVSLSESARQGGRDQSPNPALS